MIAEQYSRLRRVSGPADAAALRPALAADPYRIALFALLVISLSRIHQHFGALQPLRPALLLAGFTFAAAFLNPSSLNLRDLLRTWPAKVMVALGVVACLSVPFALSLGRAAMFIVENYSKVLLLAFLLIAAIRGVRDFVLFIWAGVVSAGILVWMALFVFELANYGNIARLGGLYTYDANDLGLVLLSMLPLALLTFQTSSRWGKLASALVVIGIGVALAKSGSRGAFVGLVATMAYLLLMLKSVPATKRIGFVVAVGLGVAVAAPTGYWEQMQTITNPTEDYNWSTTNGRVEVAKRGFSYMLRNPVFGVGIDNFPLAEATISEKAMRHIPGTGLRWTAAHNSYVQVGAELGIAGLILWSSLIFGGIVSVNRLRRRLPREWREGDAEERFLYLATIYLPVAFVGFAVPAVFVSFAYLDPIYYLAALVVGLFVSVERKLSAGEGRPVRHPARGPGWRTRASLEKPIAPVVFPQRGG